MIYKKALYMLGFTSLALLIYSYYNPGAITRHIFPSSGTNIAKDIVPTLLTSGIPSAPLAKNVRIFIHGTRLMRFFPLNMSKELRQFDEKLSTPKDGLHHFSEIPTTNNQVKIAQTLNQANAELFPLETFYLFGWSGKLDLKERRKAAKKLIIDIEHIIIEPFKKKNGSLPQITIITHSHGGNVALNMGRKKQPPFTIENLILLACPVQTETKHLSQSALFNNVYSLFSHDDLLQVLDPQLIGKCGHKIKKAWGKKSTDPLKSLWHVFKMPFFSKRVFEENTRVYHIKVCWKGKACWSPADLDVYGNIRSLGKRLTALDSSHCRGLRHIEFLIPTFMQQLPTIIAQAHTLKKDFTFFL